jgi:hypothetical protein
MPKLATVSDDELVKALQRAGNSGVEKNLDEET